MKGAIVRAAEDVAEQVAASLKRLKAFKPDDVVYAYALVVPDDFSSVAGYVNTTRFLASRPEQNNRYRWYFANWSGVATDVQMGVLLDALGDATFQDDRDLQNARQASWLVALAEALRRVRARGELVWDGKPVAAFCSVIDSTDAPWVERESARMANPPELLATFEEELAASSSGYAPAGSGPGSLQAAFTALLSQ